MVAGARCWAARPTACSWTAICSPTSSTTGGLDSTYTDSFGRTSDLHRRQDIQLQKMLLYFKGWMFDPNFRYLFYVWTSNTS
jgi:hypothetical protein